MAEQQRNLWAPWRMEYIDSLAAPDGGCFLCHYWRSPGDDAENLVLSRAAGALLVLNKFPYANGHLLIAPQQHVGGFDELDDDALLAITRRIRDAQRLLAKGMHAQGFNVGFNIGQCAGAGLPGHMHCHVVPRWGGDVNYMAVLADVKVMPQHITRTAEALRQAAAELGIAL